MMDAKSYHRVKLNMQNSTESMTLGSPTGPGAPAPFLPSYLMGDPVAVSPSSRHWSSPPKSHVSHSITNLNASMNSPAFGKCTRSESLRGRDSGRFKDKPGAPPVHGLIESVSGAGPSVPNSQMQDDFNRSISQPDASFNSSYVYPSRVSDIYCANPNRSQLFNQSSVAASPAQMDPFYTQGESLCIEDALDETWVTVFGFPPAATSFILQEFSQYGNILKHVIAPDGNWLHVHYQSKLQAKKALSKNGKVFGGTIMIGVTPCIDKRVMESDKENSLLRSSFMSPTVNKSVLDQSGIRASGKSTSMRPLSASFRSAAIETEVVPRSRTPQRSNSIVSKAMEYMFNW